ncbi:MAG TPA: glycosyltransferase [Micromonosporaceae bacterium]|nr:glycosyltransferase [Micromonosporaceae bacterium]
MDASIVVPCRHEAGNVGPLLERLAGALAGRQCEVIFVDDSDNLATVEAIDAAAARLCRSGLGVTVVHRDGAQRWGGLAGAVIDGFRRATSERVLVMDADLQHPPELVPVLLDRLDGADGSSGSDLVLASRYCPGGSSEGLDGPLRRLVSTGSTLLAKATFPLALRGVTDPMTGFFALHLRLVDPEALQARGFKILLEILARYPHLRRSEVPLRFSVRHSGDSKSDLRQGMEYLGQLPRLRLATARNTPAGRAVSDRRIWSFALGGAFAAVVGAVLLGILVSAGMDPLAAYGIQLAVSLAINFAMNYHITWRDRPPSRLRRRVGWFLLSRGATQLLSWVAFAVLTAATAWHYQFVNVLCLLLAAAVNFWTADALVFPKAATPFRHPLRPRRPAWRLPVWALLGIPALGLATGYAVLRPGPGALLTGAVVVVALFNTAISGLDVRWRLYGWRTPEALDEMRWPSPGPSTEAAERFSIIVPALHEAAVIGGTLRRLVDQDHPHVEILVSLCAGDDETIAEVERVMRDDDPHGRIRTVIRHYPRSNKPRQLNAALQECRGTVAGVIDAEDDVAPGLLSRVDALFRRSGADVVQGSVQLMTLGTRPGDWFKVHNVMEYFFWFTSRIFYQIRCGFVPLAGNTVFVRRELMVRVGGWPDNLTEDCALGVLLSTRYGAKVVAAHEPEFATREEVPHTIWNKAAGSLFWQRVRWNQGFLSILLQGEWLRLPTIRQRILAGYVLGTPFLQACSGLLLPLALVTILWFKVPIGIALLVFVPFLPIVLSMVAQLIGLHEFACSYRQPVLARHYVSLLVGAPLYQAVLMAAAFYAAFRPEATPSGTRRPTAGTTGRCSRRRRRRPGLRLPVSRRRYRQWRQRDGHPGDRRRTLRDPSRDPGEDRRHGSGPPDRHRRRGHVAGNCRAGQRLESARLARPGQ